ncbi:cytidine deaminase [Haloarcula nitratireducens]|uniref:Cytidine deaminase n=1 Tax=Haloarcula nitratireducens TaxID=2487749 RepID=A0AAW4PHF8_9EURY|nr:cytidine deaminase [Halomicroarcula nitratireducens]MBX0297527.1 cytidine deaminase [Halomicroarcula nitratireducens]
MVGPTTISDIELIEAAREARERAYCPYSEYKVGAALLADDEIYQGANMEICGRTTSIHAEMLATFNAVFDGATDFERLAISPLGETGVAPCGLCQHTIAEFTEDLRIIEDIGSDSDFVEYSLKDLIGPAYRPDVQSEFK